mgnify:CR=1 FL=1
MNNKFLDKVIEQIVSETRIIDNKLYIPYIFSSVSPSFVPSFRFSFVLRLSSPSYFSNHCKEVYSLNEQEIDYVWTKYKKEITDLIEDKELVC